MRIPQLKDCKNYFDKKNKKGKGTMVFICEGQSAAGSITELPRVLARGHRNNQAVFVLKGKPLNVWDFKREGGTSYQHVLACNLPNSTQEVGCCRIVVPERSSTMSSFQFGVLLSSAIS